MSLSLHLRSRNVPRPLILLQCQGAPPAHYSRSLMGPSFAGWLTLATLGQEHGAWPHLMQPGSGPDYMEPVAALAQAVQTALAPWWCREARSLKPTCRSLTQPPPLTHGPYQIPGVGSSHSIWEPCCHGCLRMPCMVTGWWLHILSGGMEHCGALWHFLMQGLGL